MLQVKFLVTEWQPEISIMIMSYKTQSGTSVQAAVNIYRMQ